MYGKGVVLVCGKGGGVVVVVVHRFDFQYTNNHIKVYHCQILLVKFKPIFGHLDSVK